MVSGGDCYGDRSVTCPDCGGGGLEVGCECPHERGRLEHDRGDLVGRRPSGAGVEFGGVGGVEGRRSSPSLVTVTYSQTDVDELVRELERVRVERVAQLREMNERGMLADYCNGVLSRLASGSEKENEEPKK